VIEYPELHHYFVYSSLERLQNGALRFILGPMPSSPLASLHVGYGIMPVRLRARVVLGATLARWRLQPGHLGALLSDHLVEDAHCRHYFRRHPLFLQQIWGSLSSHLTGAVMGVITWCTVYLDSYIPGIYPPSSLPKNMR